MKPFAFKSRRRIVSRGVAETGCGSTPGMSTTMRPSSMVIIGFGITGANCRWSLVWCCGAGKFWWGPGTKPGPITAGSFGGGGSLGELVS